jgi:hypothetical protein
MKRWSTPSYRRRQDGAVAGESATSGWSSGGPPVRSRPRGRLGPLGGELRRERTAAAAAPSSPMHGAAAVDGGSVRDARRVGVPRCGHRAQAARSAPPSGRGGRDRRRARHALFDARGYEQIGKQRRRRSKPRRSVVERPVRLVTRRRWRTSLICRRRRRRKATSRSGTPAVRDPQSRHMGACGIVSAIRPTVPSAFALAIHDGGGRSGRTPVWNSSRSRGRR